MKNAIILMTALLPTTGHADLIRFAASISDTKVHVLISGRTFEPIPSLDRWSDLQKHFKNDLNIVINHSVKDLAPQNPEDMPIGFWDWWHSEINEAFPAVKDNWDYVIASESYGQKVADTLNASFIPYDIKRTLNNARGTDARTDAWNNWSQILKETRERFMLKAVMFGQESVGKTTLSKLVAENLNVEWIPEYARPYLEEIGAEVTADKMQTIHLGQGSLQRMSYRKASKPALIMDTDLFSTVGYYAIQSREAPQACVDDAIKLSADVYYVLPDNVDFEPDQLRYGGDKRESDTQFWIDLLESYGRNYVMVPKGSLQKKVDWISSDISRRFDERFSKISNFQRD